MADDRTFSATSPAGNLSEALAGAIGEAGRSLNVNFFTWHLKDVAGSVGGFVGAHDVVVTIEAGAAVRTPAFASASKEQCGDWHAWHDTTPGSRPSLHVVGRCVFPAGGYKVELRPVVPQGINPEIYILAKVVTPPSGAATQQITEVAVHYREETAARYTNVQIAPDNVMVPVQEVS